MQKKKNQKVTLDPFLWVYKQSYFAFPLYLSYSEISYKIHCHENSAFLWVFYGIFFIPALTAFVFPTNQEPAFANCNLWQSAGFFVTFITSVPKEVCLSHKIIGIGSWLIVSMIMYFICELKVRRRGKTLIIQDT